jgi:hypothetical protein
VRLCDAQGGFLLVTPNQTVFDLLVETLREGDFRPGMGWGGTGIGEGYGGQTVQGVVPWFYRKKGDVPPSTSLIVDICIYDNMVDNAWCKNITQDKIKVRTPAGAWLGR